MAFLDSLGSAGAPGWASTCIDNPRPATRNVALSPRNMRLILILQPGLDNSMSASGVFIVATLLGATARTVAALLVPGEAAAILAGRAVALIVEFGREQFVREVRRCRAMTTQKVLDRSYYGKK
jgi:hypothetical protein